MSPQEASREKGSLALFLSESLRIDNKQQLDEFLDRPDARLRIRSAPYQDVFLVIKTVGLADSLELLQLTSRSQRGGFVDLDCWRKDSFHLASFMKWMAAFIQCGPEETAATARSVDPNLLVLLLKENIEVHALELDEPSPDLPLIFTPDKRFGIHIYGDGEGGTLSRLILDVIFRFDPSLGYDLLDRVRWDTSTTLEEEAYQEKRRRLEEIGFVDYYEALEIYGEVSTSLTAGRLTNPDAQEDSEACSATLPALLVASLPPGHYFLEALQNIAEQEEADRIRQSLAALANRILSVHAVTPGDLDKVEPALEEIRDTLSIALEHLTEGVMARAAEILRRHTVQVLFKIGFNLIAALRSEADRVASQRQLSLAGCRELLLESPDEEFFGGLRRLQPRFFEGLDDPVKSGYRNFQSLGDIALARSRLGELQRLVEGFWSLFPEDSLPVGLSKLAGCNLSTEEIRFSQLFNTACVNSLTAGRFRLVPLTSFELRECLGHRLPPGESFFVALNEQAQSLIAQAIDSVSLKTVLSRYARSWIKRMSEELEPVRSETSIQPGLMRSLLLKLV